MVICPTCGAPAKHRSDPEHKLLFAVIRRAAESWPRKLEGGTLDAQADYLRGWLEVEAGWSESVDIDGPEHVTVPVVRAARSMMTGTTGYIRMVQTETGVRVIRPRSINYRQVGKKEFGALAERIYQIIEVELGIKIADLKKQKEAA